jgi:hypothetical protein
MPYGSNCIIHFFGWWLEFLVHNCTVPTYLGNGGSPIFLNFDVFADRTLLYQFNIRISIDWKTYSIFATVRPMDCNVDCTMTMTTILRHLIVTLDYDGVAPKGAPQGRGGTLGRICVSSFSFSCAINISVFVLMRICKWGLLISI